MKFLRMKPGHGEVLLAEGDPSVQRGRGAARGGVPPPARRGHVGRGPDHELGSGRREAQMVKEYADIPPESERVIFFPRASGG